MNETKPDGKSGVAADYPIVVTAAIVVFVGVHYLLTRFLPAVDVAATLAKASSSDTGTAVSLALGVSAIGAMLGGFAGVVVIFGLSPDNTRFRRLRITADGRLRANWSSVIGLSFVAAFLSVVSAVMLIGYDKTTALWLLELVVLLAAHAAARLIWLIGILIALVKVTDKDADAEDRTVNADDLFKGR